MTRVFNELWPFRALKVPWENVVKLKGCSDNWQFLRKTTTASLRRQTLNFSFGCSLAKKNHRSISYRTKMQNGFANVMCYFSRTRYLTRQNKCLKSNVNILFSHSSFFSYCCDIIYLDQIQCVQKSGVSVYQFRTLPLYLWKDWKHWKNLSVLSAWCLNSGFDISKTSATSLQLI